MAGEYLLTDHSRRPKTAQPSESVEAISRGQIHYLAAYYSNAGEGLSLSDQTFEVVKVKLSIVVEM